MKLKLDKEKSNFLKKCNVTVYPKIPKVFYIFFLDKKKLVFSLMISVFATASFFLNMLSYLSIQKNLELHKHQQSIHVKILLTEGCTQINHDHY